MDKKESIIHLRKRKPLLTGSEIGRTIGVSRQYVSRILKEEGLHNIQPKYNKICEICGKRTPRGQMLCPTGECRDKYYNIEIFCAFFRSLLNSSFNIFFGHIGCLCILYYCSQS